MKKLIILKLVLIIVFIAIGDFFYIKYYDLKMENDKLKFEIEKTTLNIEKANTDVEITKKDIDKLNEEKKDSIWELDSWKLMKEKIENAL